MSTLFFDHLVIREEIEFTLNSYVISPDEREELIEIIDNTLTHHVLNVILNHLPKEKHAEFMSAFYDRPDDVAHLEYLKVYAHPQIEAEIKKQAAKIKADIVSEIHKHRTIKRKKI
jgi:hypothetical protein